MGEKGYESKTLNNMEDALTADEQKAQDQEDERKAQKAKLRKVAMVVAGVVFLVLLVVGLTTLFWPKAYPKSMAVGSTLIALPFRLKMDNGDKLEAIAVVVDKLSVEMEPHEEHIKEIERHREKFLRNEIEAKDFYKLVGQNVTKRNWSDEKFVQLDKSIVAFVGSPEPVECLKKRFKDNPYRAAMYVERYVGECYRDLFAAHPSMYDRGLSQAIILGAKQDNSIYTNFMRVTPCAPKGHPDNVGKADCSYRFSQHPVMKEKVWKAIAMGVGAKEAQAVLDNIYTKKWTSRTRSQFVEDMKEAMEAAFSSQHAGHYMASKAFFGFIVTEHGDVIKISEDFPLPDDSQPTKQPSGNPSTQ